MKKYLIIGLSIILAISVYLGYMSFRNKIVILDDVVLKDNSDNLLAIYVETSAESGVYEVYNNSTFPTTGYVFNTNKSGCVDANDNEITNALSYSNNRVIVSTRKTSKCYLYFDIDRSPFTLVMNLLADSNNSGNFSQYTGAVTDECGVNSCTTVQQAQNVYFFNGNSINNIIFEGFCWRAIRTTETRGLKLIYIGLPTTNVDHDECTATGSATALTASQMNTSSNTITYSQGGAYDKPAYVGYMYNPNSINSNYYDQIRADNVNQADSLLKEKIEYWFSNSGIDSSKLEDAVYCNNRSLRNDSPVTEAQLSSSTSGDLYFTHSIGTDSSLECPLLTDSFNTVNTKAQTNYKVGFLTRAESVTSTKQTYDASIIFWYGSPLTFSSSKANVATAPTSYVIDDPNIVSRTYSVRPVISINSTVKITGGTGSKTDPFIAS